LNETWVSPEERRIIEETKARQLAEEQRTKAEAKQRAEEEKRRKQAEVEAQQRADRERAEALRRAAEEENRRKAEAEALERAEKERARKEEEAKHREEQEQEQAFAAAKRADSISAIDTFLASHPQSRYTDKAYTLRAALVVRDDEFKAATASNDAAALQAFLNRYPKGTLADQARKQLKGAPVPGQRRQMRNVLLVVCLAALGLAVWLVGFLMMPREQSQFEFELQSDMDVLGNFLSASKVGSQAECLQKCGGTPECNLFSYSKASRCFLYSSGNFRQNGDEATGLRGLGGLATGLRDFVGRFCFTIPLAPKLAARAYQRRVSAGVVQAVRNEVLHAKLVHIAERHRRPSRSSLSLAMRSCGSLVCLM
jgi:chemotaxis protein histidine kinase CheA